MTEAYNKIRATDPACKTEMSLDEYIAIDRVSASSIRSFLNDPHSSPKRDKEYKSSLLLGTLIHKKILEPDTFDDIYTKLLPDSLIQNFNAVIDGIKKNEAVTSLLAKEGEPEALKLFEVSGVPCKARLDFITKDNLIVELKTARNIYQCISPEKNKKFLLKHIILKYRYDLQIAFYYESLLQEGVEKPPNPVLILAETNPPYKCFMFIVGDNILHSGKHGDGYNTGFIEAIQLMKNKKNIPRWKNVNELDL